VATPIAKAEASKEATPLEMLDASLNPDSSKLMEAVKGYLPPADWSVVQRAVNFAAQAHAGQFRASGEPYVIHPIAAALTIAEMQLDRDSIVSALLHDVPEDTAVTLEEIQKEFGDKVAHLVEGVTKLSKIKWDPASQDKATQEKQEQAENLRKMFLAMVDDVRVVLIKLADRLHNMQTLQFKSRPKQIKIATETLEIFAPLANRLGIWNIKWQLEDLCFKYLHPEEFEDLVSLLDEKRESRERYLQRVQKTIHKALDEAGIQVYDVSGRPKHIYSIYKKMQRKNRPLDQIYDVLAVRVIVGDVRDCYGALGIIHTLWRPVPGEFDDYIATPKESMYQSLHTAVLSLDGKPLEVQIRTKEMHKVAEYGIAAHWRYKEGGKRDVEFEAKIAWLRRLIDWKEEGAEHDALEFVDSLKADVFQDQVYVFTPKGDIIDLPAGATPIDFAYRIHSAIGHQCGGARVNDRLVPLNYQLQNGEVVKIIQAKNRKGPSRDWLNPNLGYLKTAGARDKVRQWFRRQEREENISHGREILDEELKRLGLSNVVSYESVASHFSKYEKLEDFLAAIGYGGVTISQITSKLVDAAKDSSTQLPEFMQPSSATTTVSDRVPTVASGMTVSGLSGLLTTLASCCHPMQGDEIIGYVTRTKGISVHRADCPNVVNVPEKDQGRLIRVSWGETSIQYYRVPVRMEAIDRVGLLRDLSILVADEKVNMGDFRTISSSKRGIIHILFTVEVTSLEQLSRLLTKLQSVRDVLDVRRDVPSLGKPK
jgi:GTP pyrophosphokinase